MDNQQIFNLLENPEGPLEEAQEEAEEKVAQRTEEQLGRTLEESAVRKLAYTQYFDWDRHDPPDIMLILESPGDLSFERETAEPLNVFDKDRLKTGTELIRFYQRYGYSWFFDSHPSFSKKFFETISDVYSELPVGKWTASNDQDTLDSFFSQVYVTDTVKYRCESLNSTRTLSSYRQILSKEISAVKPDIIIPLGRKAWNAVCKPNISRLECVCDCDGVYPECKISNVHGHPFQVKDTFRTSKILPLVHVSNRNFQFKDEEYFARMEEGLKSI